MLKTSLFLILVGVPLIHIGYFAKNFNLNDEEVIELFSSLIFISGILISGVGLLIGFIYIIKRIIPNNFLNFNKLKAIILVIK